MKSEQATKQHTTYLFAGIGILILCGLSFFAGYSLRGSGTSSSTTSTAQSGQQEFGNGQMGGPNGRMGNGTFGEVTAVSETSITINDSRQNQSKTFSITEETTVTNNRESGALSDIEVGDQVMIEPGSDDSSVASRIMIGGMGITLPSGNRESSGA